MTARELAQALKALAKLVRGLAEADDHAAALDALAKGIRELERRVENIEPLPDALESCARLLQRAGVRDLDAADLSSELGRVGKTQAQLRRSRAKPARQQATVSVDQSYADGLLELADGEAAVERVKGDGLSVTQLRALAELLPGCSARGRSRAAILTQLQQYIDRRHGDKIILEFGSRQATKRTGR